MFAEENARNAVRLTLIKRVFFIFDMNEQRKGERGREKNNQKSVVKCHSYAVLSCIFPLFLVRHHKLLYC